MVAEVIAQVDPAVAVRVVRARRGKWLRAEPVAGHSMCSGRVSHAGTVGGTGRRDVRFGVDGLAGGRSPDRVDALVWALDRWRGAPGRCRGMRGSGVRRTMEQKGKTRTNCPQWVRLTPRPARAEVETASAGADVLCLHAAGVAHMVPLSPASGAGRLLPETRSSIAASE